MFLVVHESLRVLPESVHVAGSDVDIGPSTEGAQTAGGASVLGQHAVLVVWQVVLQLGVGLQLVEEHAHSGGEAGAVQQETFSVGTPGAGVQTIVRRRGVVGGADGAITEARIYVLALQQYLIHLAGLLAQLEGVAQPGVVGLTDVGLVVHGRHVSLGILEGQCHGVEFGQQVLLVVLQVLVLHLKPIELV